MSEARTLPTQGLATRGDVVGAAVERARRIPELRDDWDGEGSRGYLRDTLDGATELLRAIADGIPPVSGRAPGVADIQPGPDGSIDIEIAVGEKRLLLNVSYEAQSPVLFYGHALDRTLPIKGELGANTSTRFLSEWLVA